MGLLKRRQPRPEKPNSNWDARGNFRPQPRGKLTRAFADDKSLARIAPETPRPAEMLEHVAVVGDDKLTADDEALHELLVAHAYEQTDRLMDRAEYSIPTSYALSLLGENARRRGLKASLERLRSTTVSFGVARGRRYENVQLLVPWSEREGVIGEEIHYIIPPPIQVLMASQDRYAHLELAPLGRMKSRYGIRLYRHLALAMSRKEWSKDGDNLHTIRVTVDAMRAWLGVKDGHVGQLRLRAVDPAIRDLVHVQRFSLVPADETLREKDVTGWVQIEREQKRGAPVAAWVFTMRLNPPRRFHVRQAVVADEIMWSVGAPDEPRFRTPQSLWLRASSFGWDHGISGRHAGIFRGWLVAINEALTGNAVTDGYGIRDFRGQRLLDAIDGDGAEDAAWDWLVEEVKSPDLLKLETVIGPSWRKAEREARIARYNRWRDFKYGPDRKRRTAASSSPKAVPEPLREKAPEAAEIVPTAPLSWIEFVLDDVATGADAEAMQEAIFEMTLSGDPAATVDGTIRYRTGHGTDTLFLGGLPISDVDLSFIAERFATIIDDVSVGRKEI